MTARKKMLLFASLVVIALTDTLITWTLQEPKPHPERLVVQCAGFITNSTETVATYVISNRNAYAIKVENYFVGNPMGWDFEGVSPPEIILKGGSYTNVTMPIYTNITPRDEFIVLYCDLSFKRRFSDYALSHNFSRWLPNGFIDRSSIQQQCILCPK